MIKIWLDDCRFPPDGYYWCHSVNEAKTIIEAAEREPIQKIDLIDCDHDLGDFAPDGGDGIKLLDWLEETGRRYPIRVHTMNPVGRENMLRVVKKNNWVLIW